MDCFVCHCIGKKEIKLESNAKILNYCSSFVIIVQTVHLVHIRLIFEFGLNLDVDNAFLCWVPFSIMYECSEECPFGTLEIESFAEWVLWGFQ